MGITHAGFAVNVVGNHQVSHQRRGSTGSDGNVFTLHQRQQTQRIVQGFFRRLVTGGGGNGFNVQFW
ncbi:hypothetical protein D3C85_1714640 [compost metagenome]